MAHYTCRGKKCYIVLDRPSVCMNPSCEHRYKLLEECACPGKEHHVRSTPALHSVAIEKNVLDVFHFGIALGAFASLLVFFIGVFAMFGIGESIARTLSSFYIGYKMTLLGSLTGALWAFLDGFIGGVFIAWVYNSLSRKFSS